jgi:hypothetical protein
MSHYSNLLVFGGTTLTSLVIGGIVTATYVTVENRKHPEEPVSTTTIVFMMLCFVLLGLFAFSLYYAYTKPTTVGVTGAIITEGDIARVKASEQNIKDYKSKVAKLPRLDVTDHCEGDICFGDTGPRRTQPTTTQNHYDWL